MSVTNLQEKRLVITRMEVVPPSPTAGLPAPPSPAATTAADAGDDTVTWANLPNGPVLYDERVTAAAATATTGAAASPATAAKAAIATKSGGGGEVALSGAGDSYTCCFTARGHSEHPAPLGKLKVTWRPEDDAGATPAVAAAVGDGGPSDQAGVGSTAAAAAVAAAAAAVGEAVTEFPLPVLSARPPTLSARLKVPPHARVGVEFSMR